MKGEENGSDYNCDNVVCPSCGMGYTISKKKELVDLMLNDLTIFGIEC